MEDRIKIRKEVKDKFDRINKPDQNYNDYSVQAKAYLINPFYFIQEIL